MAWAVHCASWGYCAATIELKEVATWLLRAWRLLATVLSTGETVAQLDSPIMALATWATTFGPWGSARMRRKMTENCWGVMPEFRASRAAWAACSRREDGEWESDDCGGHQP